MKYNLSASVTISIYTEVEADSEEQAIEIAHKRQMMDIPTNPGYPEDEFWCATELDGEPCQIKIEEQSA